MSGPNHSSLQHYQFISSPCCRFSTAFNAGFFFADTIFHGSLTFMNISLEHVCWTLLWTIFSDNLYREKFWKTETVFPLKKREGLFTIQPIKGNFSLQGKGSAGLFQSIIKDLGSLTRDSCTCVLQTDLFLSLSGKLGDKVNGHET